MPVNNRKGKSKPVNLKQISGPGAVALLLLVAVFLVAQAWNDNHPNDLPEPLETISAVFTETYTLTQLPSGATATVSQPPPSTSAPKGETISVYFSDPLNGISGGGPETALIAAIDRAQKSVDMAIYNLTLDSVASALISAHQRGVQVRLVMESEAMEKKQPLRLAGAGIPIVGDQREGLMHNKFTVIDNAEVWIGSMNYTSTSAYSDFNNLVRLPSTTAVEDYAVEFEEMFTENLFGPDTRAATPNPTFNIGGTPVEVYFSPDDGVAEQIIQEISAAKKSIDFLAFSFTSDDIAFAILDRVAAGVTVRGVFDEGQVGSNQGGEYTRLKRQGIDVLQDRIPGLLHDKVYIIDGQTVITGSYNFSRNAEQTNDENLVILHDRAIAAQYLKHFKTVYESGK